MDDNVIKSVDEFLKELFLKTKSQTKDEIEPRLYWFRGESNADFTTPLVPNGYRVLAETFKDDIDDLFVSNHIKQLEQNISAEFDRKALPFIISKRIKNTSWNRYFLMQHYQIYTRLLDWTENALLALFFAVNDNQTVDAKVWILRPFFLNSYSIKTLIGSDKNCFIIPPTSNSAERMGLKDEKGKLRLNELTRRYLRMDFNSKEGDDCTNIYYPLAIYPSFLDERMTAQKACFTIFGNKINGLKTIKNCNDTIIDSITIDRNSKRKIMEELRLIGFDFASIYPDLDGLGKSITDKYKNKFSDNSEIIPHFFKNYK